MLRKFVSGFVVAILLLTVSSCEDDDDDAPAKNITNFSGTMSGANEVPAVTTTATGNVTAEFDNDTKILTLVITYSGLSSDITVWHVHKGATGAFGPPVAGLTYGTLGASPFTWSTALDATMEADLMANLYYANIHTVNNAGGEIRGQLNKE
jgi:CHRD domain